MNGNSAISGSLWPPARSRPQLARTSSLEGPAALISLKEEADEDDDDPADLRSASQPGALFPVAHVFDPDYSSRSAPGRSRGARRTSSASRASRCVPALHLRIPAPTPASATARHRGAHLALGLARRSSERRRRARARPSATPPTHRSAPADRTPPRPAETHGADPPLASLAQDRHGGSARRRQGQRRKGRRACRAQPARASSCWGRHPGVHSGRALPARNLLHLEKAR